MGLHVMHALAALRTALAALRLRSEQSIVNIFPHLFKRLFLHWRPDGVAALVELTRCREFQAFVEVYPLRDFILSVYAPSSRCLVLGLELGRGTSGVVYLGMHLESGELIAVKKVNYAEQSAKQQERLMAEVRLSIAMQHPNIVRCYGAEYVSPGLLYLMMERCPLYDLEVYFTVVKKHVLTLLDVEHIMRELSKSLGFLHAQSVVHRDLKPQNVLVFGNKSGDAPISLKLCDFTFSKILTNHELLMTTTVGSPNYMAPEVINGQSYTEKADLWSLGVMLFRFLYAEYPYKAVTINDLRNQVNRSDPVYPVTRLVEERLMALLRGLLVRDPKARLGWEEYLTHAVIRGPSIQEVEDESAKLRARFEKMRLASAQAASSSSSSASTSSTAVSGASEAPTSSAKPSKKSGPVKPKTPKVKMKRTAKRDALKDEKHSKDDDVDDDDTMEVTS